MSGAKTRRAYRIFNPNFRTGWNAACNDRRCRRRALCPAANTRGTANECGRFVRSGPSTFTARARRVGNGDAACVEIVLEEMPVSCAGHPNGRLRRYRRAGGKDRAGPIPGHVDGITFSTRTL